MSIEIIKADLDNERHAEHILYLTDNYARDVMGNGAPLPEKTKANLIDGLKAMPTAIIFLAYENEEPVGIANCFIGFSTFAAKKLINVHDLAVVPHARNKGIGKKLLKTVENKAKSLDCAQISLEVLENNPAKRLYERFGFDFERPYYLFAKKNID